MQHGLHVKARPPARRRGGGWVTPAAMALALAAGVVYCHTRLRCRRLAREMAAAEETLADRRQRRITEEVRWAPMCSVKSVRAAMKNFGIEMDWASERTVYVVRSAPPSARAQNRGHLAAARLGE